MKDRSRRPPERKGVRPISAPAPVPTMRLVIIDALCSAFRSRAVVFNLLLSLDALFGTGPQSVKGVMFNEAMIAD